MGYIIILQNITSLIPRDLQFIINYYYEYLDIDKTPSTSINNKKTRKPNKSENSVDEEEKRKIIIL